MNVMKEKGEKNINKLLKNANYVADHTIFIASWLNLDLWMNTNKSSIILNGGDKTPLIARKMFDGTRIPYKISNTSLGWKSSKNGYL